MVWAARWFDANVTAADGSRLVVSDIGLPSGTE